MILANFTKGAIKSMPNIPKTIYVTPDDRLQAVFDRAAPGSTLMLAPGIYRQKAVITTPGLTLIGSGKDKTVFVWDDYARKTDENGFPLITFRTYTLAVAADGVTIRNLAIVNDALAPEIKGQEIALTVYGSDFLMEECILTSTQDTLFVGPLPPDLIERYTGFLRDELRLGGEMKQTFRSCRIEGTVDFIFGCGNALFDRCEIRSLNDARNTGYVAAPAHSPEQTEGLVFRDCDFTFESGVAAGSIYLARPWRDYGLARFENCRYAAHIASCGFDKWNDTRRDLTARFYETPSVPGRVSWVNRK